MPRLRAFTRAKVGGLPGPFWLLWSGTPINRIGYLVEPFLAYTTLPLAMRLQGLSSSYGRSVNMRTASARSWARRSSGLKRILPMPVRKGTRAC